MIDRAYLTILTQKTTDLANEYKALIDRIAEVDREWQQFEQERKRLNEKQGIIAKQEALLRTREASVDKKLETASTKQQETIELQITLTKRKEILDREIKQFAASSQEREKKLTELERIVMAKKEELTDLFLREEKLNARTKALEEERALIEKEKKIDRARKEELDARERNLTLMQEKVQRLLTS